MRCHFCGNEIPREEKIYRNTLCPFCARDLRICLNCHFYSPGSHWDCRETIPESVKDKDRANFCDYFRPAASGTKQEGPNLPKEDNGRTRFDKLFGDP